LQSGPLCRPRLPGCHGSVPCPPPGGQLSHAIEVASGLPAWGDPSLVLVASRGVCSTYVPRARHADAARGPVAPRLRVALKARRCRKPWGLRRPEGAGDGDRRWPSRDTTVRDSPEGSVDHAHLGVDIHEWSKMCAMCTSIGHDRPKAALHAGRIRRGPSTRSRREAQILVNITGIVPPPPRRAAPCHGAGYRPIGVRSGGNRLVPYS
jgi:hypothetical protein